MISVTFDSHVYLFTDEDGVFTVGVAIHESEQASLCGPARTGNLTVRARMWTRQPW